MVPVDGASSWPQGPAATPITIPRGQYRLDRALDDGIRAAARAPARASDDRRAHPIFAFLAALGGMGVPVAELCRMCGSSIDDGPVLARTSIDHGPPMEVDRDYVVGGEVSAITRKPSRRFGQADHVDIRLHVESDGRRFADVTLSWIMPRPEAA